MGPIVIAIPTLAYFDAMGHDVLMSAEALKNQGYDIYIYAEHCSDNLKPLVISLDDTIKLLKRSDSLLFYHMGVLWAQLPKLLEELRGKFIVKYHNMTPPRYFRHYDLPSYAATCEGLQQIKWLFQAKIPDGLIGASLFNLKELSSLVRKSSLCLTAQLQEVIPPYVGGGRTFTQTLGTRKKTKNQVTILFVGRIVPNKGLHHLIGILKSYEQFFGKSIQLKICGNVGGGFVNYKNELLELALSSGIGDQLEFVHHADAEKLSQLYQNSDVFLCVSEHEGFCVPIIEAQRYGLPVIAWNQGAVGHTLGSGGLLLDRLDYDVFAEGIHQVTFQKGIKEELSSQGFNNAKLYEDPLISDKLVSYIKRVESHD